MEGEESCEIPNEENKSKEIPSIAKFIKFKKIGNSKVKSRSNSKSKL